MEFEAVVLCGEGRRLHPLTPNTPKALLPVANKPVLSYALDWCARAHFMRTTVAVNDEDYEAVASYVFENFPAVKLFRVPTGSTSGEILGLVAPGIDRDFAILPCDFVTDADPEELVSVHRAQDSDETIVTGYYYRNMHEGLDNKSLAADVILHSESGSTRFLLDSHSRKAIIDSRHLRMSMAVLWKFPKVIAATETLATGIYLFRYSVLQVLDSDIDLRGKSIQKVVRDLARQAWRHRERRRGVALEMLTTSYIRANNVPAYLEANRWMMRQRARTAGKQQPNTQSKGTLKGAVGLDSLVAPDVPIGERSSVKRTAIGFGASVGRKCRLNGCVILDGARIDDDVVLENCILGQNAAVESRCRLANCEIEGGYRVVTGTEAKNEVLKGANTSEFADNDEEKIYEQMYSSLSSDGSEDDDEDDDDQYVESEGEINYDNDSGDDFFDRS